MAVSAVFVVALGNPAAAQDRFEANTRGYFGGYSTFGGYYDTFGGYGGQNNYGYRRYNQVVSPTAKIIAVPTVQPAEQGETCAWLRRKAKETVARKWQARYAACRSGN